MAFMEHGGFRFYYEDSGGDGPCSCSCTAPAATT